MLHVTNGSIAVSRLHDVGLPGEFLPWDDVLHEGPVRAGLSDDDLRHERAAFLAISWGDVESIERSLRVRDETLALAAAQDGEIVLWFEHDLYDQLHVMQLLDRLARMDTARRAGVSAILADDYLTGQSDEQLRAWFDGRRPVESRRWQAAQAAWAAFGAPLPSTIDGFAHDGAWMSLRSALRRHLQQFPSVHTGLSRTEAQTLAALAGGPLSLRTAFRASNHEVEDAVFMGDSAWWFHIRPLLTGPHPLLAVVGQRPGDYHHPEWWRDDEGAPQLTLTESGAQVLAGEADHVALNGINRWLGGVHLMALPGDGPTGTLWRWDEATGHVVQR